MVAFAARVGSGRSSGGSAGGDQQRRRNGPAFAWEFLRRNSDYRADFARWRDGADLGAGFAKHWGLQFAADPLFEAEAASVFWRGDVAPGLELTLEVRTSDTEQAGALLPSSAAAIDADDGLHLRTRRGLQLHLRNAHDVQGPFIVALAFDRDFGLRVRAVEALAREASGRPPVKNSLSPAQVLRLERCLAALDGWLGGRSYREIADDIFKFSDATDENWRTSSVRATTIRLVKAGRSLMSGGYLQLLRHGL